MEVTLLIGFLFVFCMISFFMETCNMFFKIRMHYSIQVIEKKMKNLTPIVKYAFIHSFADWVPVDFITWLRLSWASRTSRFTNCWQDCNSEINATLCLENKMNNNVTKWNGCHLQFNNYREVGIPAIPNSSIRVVFTHSFPQSVKFNKCEQLLNVWALTYIANLVYWLKINKWFNIFDKNSLIWTWCNHNFCNIVLLFTAISLSAFDSIEKKCFKHPSIHFKWVDEL